jgi:type IV secretory pathway VirJ component
MAAVCSLLAASAAMGQKESTPASQVKDLPLVELRSSGQSKMLAVFLSGDGGWADIDRQIGQTLSERGVDVIGLDDRAYLRSGTRGPDGTAQDVARASAFYMQRWGDERLLLLGYSRGANFLPFVANRMPPALSARLALIAMLGLQEHASFKYRFSDLWATRSRASDTPILPELERLRGTNMLCVYGKDEDESLCRGIDSTLVHPVMRPGKHHFDGDYRALTTLILSRLGSGPR